MYHKIFEKKFRDSAVATDFLDETGWTYMGKGGFIREFHLYEGVTIDRDGRLTDRYKLRLHADGHVELYCDYSISRILSTTGLPNWVLPSKDIHDYLAATVKELNEKLIEEHGYQFCIRWEGHEKFRVYEWGVSGEGPGITLKKPCRASFRMPVLAFEWAVSQCD